MTSRLTIPIFFLSVMLLACQSKPKEVAVDDSGLIPVTRAQFESEKMELGQASRVLFSDRVHFTGTVVPSVNGLAQISLPVPGIISRIYCQPGQQVNKGAPLLEVTGNDLIDMQQSFAESAANLVRLKSEYERVKVLNKENIGSKKEYILAESVCLTEQAKYNALKIKLENIGLDVERIKGDRFYTSYSVQSPMDGCVTKINVNIGQYTESQHNTAEILDSRSFQLKISVFEKDISKVREDQTVEFYPVGNQGETFRSKLISTGKTILDDSKSVECYAGIADGTKQHFVSNQFVEGDIFVANDSVSAVPETAILHSANKSYLLILEKEAADLFYFKKIAVAAGRSMNELVELTGEIPAGRLLVKGIYNIQAE